MTGFRDVRPGVDYSADEDISYVDLGADVSKAAKKSGMYQILDYSSSPSHRFYMREKGKPSYVDKWQPVVLKMDTPWGIRNFIEVVVFYWPEHPKADQDGLRGYVKPEHLFQYAPRSVSEAYLRSIVFGFGRPEPGTAGTDRLRSSWLAEKLGRGTVNEGVFAPYRPEAIRERLMYTSEDGCDVQFKDYPAWGLAPGTKTAYEIVFQWVAAAKPGCAMSSSVNTAPNAGIVFSGRISWVYLWPSVDAAPSRIEVSTGWREKSYYEAVIPVGW